MNIGILVPTITVGGAEKIAIETASGLKNEDDNVVLFVLNKKNNATTLTVKDGISLVYISSKIKFFELARKFKEFNIDKCLCYLERANFLGLWACLLAGVDYCASVHTAPRAAFSKRPIINRFFIKLTYKIIAILDLKVICVSSGIEDELRADYGIKKIKTIPNFIDCDVINEKSKINSYNNNDEIDFIFVGRIETVKGCDVFIDSLIYISDWILDNKIRVAIIGDGTMKGMLEEKINRSSIVANVIFLGELDNPYGAMAKSKNIVVPSYAEGFGLVILEALALNLRVIYSKCDFGPKEIINKYFPEYEYLGFFNPSENRGLAIEDLSNKIKMAYDRKADDIDWNDKIERVKHSFSREEVCCQIKEFLV
ncbi:glycosyltransferase [Citrobacter sp. JGM124]|uniref:glycosyltransferase n=1 Tax=Citrobacter sp. JGM124 TaxID=2799789 RepID=UPI001BA6D60E|nr:glycosyltransferase [Citrobacter sp. JGM124]MBS0847953.1 glycosyltransferase [Citrobacter sp. JGM124]